MTNLLGTAAVINALFMSSWAAADQKNDVINAFNSALQTWEQATRMGNTNTLEVEIGEGVRYTLETWSHEWTRSFGTDFDSGQGSANASLSLSIDYKSHDLSYPIYSWENTEVYLWWWVIEYSNLTASASAFLSHPDVGYHTASVSDKVSDILYDPFISLWLEVEYPLWENLIWYGSLDWKYGISTHSAELEMWLRQDFWNAAVYGAFWVHSFWVHNPGPEGVLSDTLLWWETWYVKIWGEYCFTSSICRGVSLDHWIFGPGEWDTNIGLWLAMKF